MIAVFSLAGCKAEAAEEVTEEEAVEEPEEEVFDELEVDEMEEKTANKGKIIFYSDRDGNLEIYIMNIDGSEQIRLTNNPESDESPFSKFRDNCSAGGPD